MAVIQSWKPGGTKRSSGYIKYTSQGDHVHPEPYSTYGGNFPIGSGIDLPNEPFVHYWASDPIAHAPRARNKAWAKFVNTARSESASLGVALAEWPQSLSMIANRASQLRRGYRDLRRGDFRGFLRQFGMDPKRKHRNKVSNVANSASSLWLEYSFGWKPLTQDIYEGFEAMSQPVPGGPVSGSGFESISQQWRSQWYTQTFNGSAFVKYGAEVHVSNPNQYLLQQLGLANPLLIAWELVPFSFMVDWVFDVGTCLGATTDLLGMSVTHKYSTGYFRGRAGKAGNKSSGGPPGPFRYAPNCFIMKRALNHPFPLPNASFRANIGQSMNRAANAVSLLGQILTK